MKKRSLPLILLCILLLSIPFTVFFAQQVQTITQYAANLFPDPLILTAPNGGESYEPSTPTETVTLPISWEFVPDEELSVTYPLTTNIFILRHIIDETYAAESTFTVETTSSGPHMYEWPIPVDYAPGNYKVAIRITLPDNSSFSDTSEGFFTIRGDTPPITLTPDPGETSLFLTVKLHGIGTAGDTVNPQGVGNMNPVTTTRPVSVSFATAINNEEVGSSDSTLHYNSTTGDFTGFVVKPEYLETTGYNIRITVPGYLPSQVLGVELVEGQSQNAPEVSLVSGDINNDEALDILDYNLLISCYGSDSTQSLPTCIDIYYTEADLYDDGDVNFIDLNLWLREFSKKT